MIFAPLFSGASGVFREQILVAIDALCYCACALVAVHLAPHDDAKRAAGSLGIYIALSLTAAWWRHMKNAGAACHRNDKAAGGMRIAPVKMTDATPTPVSPLCVLPLAILWLSVALMYTSGPTLDPVVMMLMLLGSEVHVWIAHGHGDNTGGKHVPSQFAIMIHFMAALAHTPPAVAVSLHRVFILCTYFVTGFRKVYCTGWRWADGKNLQVMLGSQGLYHDMDSGPSAGLALNFWMARSRALCTFGSASVLGLQLLMPVFLLWPRRDMLTLAFVLAMSFHAGNHLLWRINFFGSWCPALVVLLVPIDQMDLTTLWRSVRNDISASPICCVLIVYFVMQFGHACDEASEKCAARFRRALASAPRPLQSLGIAAVTVFEFHLLGDYYTEYWPEYHPPAEAAIACVVIRDPDGAESLLPASTDYYFRRHLNGWISWPRALGANVAECRCRIERRASPGSSVIGEGRTDESLDLPLAEVLRRLCAHLEQSFVRGAVLSHLRHSGCTCKLRVRGLAYDGTSLLVRRLWECDLDLPGKTK